VEAEFKEEEGIQYSVMVEKNYEDGSFDIYVRQGDSMYIEYFCTTDCERKMHRLVDLLKKEREEFFL
jgi:hypothetical protein